MQYASTFHVQAFHDRPCRMSLTFHIFPLVLRSSGCQPPAAQQAPTPAGTAQRIVRQDQPHRGGMGPRAAASRHEVCAAVSPASPQGPCMHPGLRGNRRCLRSLRAHCSVGSAGHSPWLQTGHRPRPAKALGEKTCHYHCDFLRVPEGASQQGVLAVGGQAWRGFGFCRSCAPNSGLSEASERTGGFPAARSAAARGQFCCQQRYRRSQMGRCPFPGQVRRPSLGVLRPL